MPQIRQYEAPEGIGLRPSELGISAVAAAARRVQSNYNEAAADITSTGQRIASTVKDVGDVAKDYIDHQQISHGANTFANLVNNKTKEWDDIAKNADPNDPTVAAKFVQDNLEPTLEKFKEGFGTEKSQQWAETHVDQFRQHMFTKTSADMATMAGHAAVINSRQTVNGLSNTVRGDPSSLDFSLSTLESATGAIVDSSPNLRGTEAAKVRSDLLQKGKEEIVKSAALGYIEKTGEVPSWATDPKYSPYINGTELKQFAQAARYYERLGKSEQRAARVQADYEAKNDFNKRVNDLEVSTAPKNIGDPPTLPPDYWDKIRDLSKHPGAAQEPGRLKTMVTNGEVITNRLNKPEPLAGKSHDAAVDLLRRMRASDDTKMTDLAPLYEAYDRGDLNNADFNFVKKEFAESRTPDGERLTQTKSELLKAIGPAIDKSNPLMGKIDQDGKLNIYRFEWDLNQKIAEYRKANKNPYDLFDPSKPDYVGRPEALQQYQKPLSQSIQDQARRLTGRNITGQGETITGIEVTNAPPAPRKPNETPAQYLKRMGVQ
jgi:hypothetical protein